MKERRCRERGEIGFSTCPVQGPQRKKTSGSPELRCPGPSFSVIHGSSPFSNLEITLGLESSYPAYEVKKKKSMNVCVEV